MNNYETQKWTRILNHPNSTDAQKADARKHLESNTTPEVEPAAFYYDPALDAEIETLMTQPHPPFSFDKIWPPPASPATPIYHLLLGSRLLGGSASAAVVDVPKLLAIFNRTESHFIRHQATRGLCTYAIIHKTVLPAELYERVYALLSAIEDETLFDPKMPRGEGPDWLGLGSINYSQTDPPKTGCKATDGQ